MWRVLNTNQVSGIAAALFAIAVAAGLAEVRHAEFDLHDFSLLREANAFACNEGFLESRCSVDQPS